MNPFTFGGITHVIENPIGHAPGWNYSCVGTVPAEMVHRPFATVQEIQAAIAVIPDAKLCDMPGCACRKLF